MTLTDIIGYQPHGLAVVSEHGTICRIYGTSHIDVVLDEYRSVLRPMDDLATEIVEKEYNDGKPFVPIVELAKTQYPTDEWRVTKHGGATTGSFTVSWEGEDFGFQMEDKYEGSQVVRYPHRLYDLLHRWHFDYRGLIEAGDAVSIYDLKWNPYENE